MTVSELKKRLDDIIENNPRQANARIVIPNNKKGMMGGTPATEVVNCYAGFDWNNNKVFLQPENDMIEETTIKT